MSHSGLESYEMVLQSIYDLAGKRKFSSLLAPLRKLSMYIHKIPIEVTLQLAEYLSSMHKGNDERKSIRIIHMIIGETYFLGTTEQKQMLKNILKQEIEYPMYPRYASCIKIYISLCKDLNDTQSILMAIEPKLKEGLSKTGGDKFGSSIGMLTELYSCLFFAQLPLKQIESYIRSGMNSDNTSVIRFSLGCLMISFNNDTDLVEKIFSTFIKSDGTPSSSIRLDTQGYLYYIRLCYFLYIKTNCSNPLYIKGLCSCLNGNPSIALITTSIELLSKIGYTQINKFDTRGNETQGLELVKFMLDNLNSNLTYSINNNDQPLFITVTRCLINIIKALIKQFKTRSNIQGNSFFEQAKTQFDSIYQSCLPMIEHQNMALKTAGIQICIWLVTPLENGIQSEECSNLLNKLKVTELPSDSVTLVMNTLHSRIECTPELASFSVLLSWAWLKLNPLSISVNDLTTGWKLCFENKDDHDVELTLEHIYKVLDLSVPNVEIEQYLSILKTSSIWFLGECSSFFKNTTNESEAKDIENKDTINDAIFDASQYYQSIILRLQKGALIGDWATRRESIRALGKIGIKAGEPIRITIYEMLRNLAEHSEDGSVLSHDLIDPIIEMLDIIYTAIENNEDVDTLIKNQLLIFEQGNTDY